MPPLPNTLYTRDTTCWIYGGVTLNPLFYAARLDETLLMKAIYRFHPDFVGANIWWGDPERHWAMAAWKAGTSLVPGNRTVIVGMSQRTSRQAITQLAVTLFERLTHRPDDRGRNAAAPGGHASGTVLTFADCDCVTVYPDIVDNIVPLHPAARRIKRLGLRVVEEDKPFLEGWRPMPSAFRTTAGDRDRRQRL